ncbi:type IV pilus modification PilV family protein [Clostridiisalibacter paucivorans]|uniref:type IV pilus modification PilV family protein n=1 Tax=Clostridiisalibacter paucivorans TaxID=408753 RepID=UPI00047E7DDB|nr:type II secretion system protein [Clostridiisalibacter paucivorans]
MFKDMEKGFTLLEILIALGILSIIVLPIYSLYLSSMKINKKSDNIMQAMALAQQKMEYIKSQHEAPKDDMVEVNGFSIEIKSNQIHEYDFDIIEEMIEEKEYDIEIGDDIVSENNSVNIVVDNNIVNINREKLINFQDNDVDILIDIDNRSNVLITGENYIDGVILNLYFVKSDKNKVTFKNKGGSIVTYFNVERDFAVNGFNNGRIYEVIIIVKKDREILHQLTGYKTFVN